MNEQKDQVGNHVCLLSTFLYAHLYRSNLFLGYNMFFFFRKEFSQGERERCRALLDDAVFGKMLKNTLVRWAHNALLHLFRPQTVNL